MGESVIFIKEIKTASSIKKMVRKFMSTKQCRGRKNVAPEPNVPGPLAASPLAASPLAVSPLAARPTALTTIPLKPLWKVSLRKIDFYINIPNVQPLTGSLSRPQNANANGRRPLSRRPLSVIAERIRTNARIQENSRSRINREKAATATGVMHPKKNKGMIHF